MKRRFWRRVDAALRKVGLMRCSQQQLQELTITNHHGERYVKIVLRGGHRVAGFLEPESRGIIKYGDNPLVKR